MSEEDSGVFSIDSESLDTDFTPKITEETVLVKQHERFYFDDGSVEFLVENVLYKVHRSIFARHSPWFRERFQQPVDSLPPGWQVHQTPLGENIFINHTLGGVSFIHPRPKGNHVDAIVLDDITPLEFDSFLTVLYPL